MNVLYELIDKEIEKIEARLAELKQARKDLNRKPTDVVIKPAPAKVVVGPGQLTCAEAIDQVLEGSDHAISIAAIEAGVLAFGGKVAGSPSTTSIRAALSRRKDSMGWKKRGKGRGARWAKADK